MHIETSKSKWNISTNHCKCSSKNLLYFCKSTVRNKYLSKTACRKVSLFHRRQQNIAQFCVNFFPLIRNRSFCRVWQETFKTNVVRAHFEWILFWFSINISIFFVCVCVCAFLICVRKSKCIWQNVWNWN